MKLFAFRLAFVALIFGFFVGCNKPKDSETKTTAYQVFSEGVFEDVQDIVDAAAKGTLDLKLEEGNEALSTCQSVTFDSVSSPKVITIDFGNTNCNCTDGKLRKGKIVAKYVGNFFDSGTVITTTFIGYFYNNNKIEGSRVSTNLGINSSNRYLHSIVVNGNITQPDSVSYSWSCDRQKLWIAGYSTPSTSDDKYSLTGTSKGYLANNGMGFYGKITAALVRNVDCHQFVSGKFTLTPEGKPDRTGEYGDGTCDNKVSVNVNGVTSVLSLKF